QVEQIKLSLNRHSQSPTIIAMVVANDIGEVATAFELFTGTKLDALRPGAYRCDSSAGRILIVLREQVAPDVPSGTYVVIQSRLQSESQHCFELDDTLFQWSTTDGLAVMIASPGKKP